MEWTTRYYMSQAKQWRQWREASRNTQITGIYEYAAAKVKMWNYLGKAAEDVFIAANSERVAIWKEVS